jgi:hypothetical protein
MSKAKDHFYSDDFIRRLRVMAKEYPIAAHSLRQIEQSAEALKVARKSYHEAVENAFALHVQQMSDSLRPCHQERLKAGKLWIYIYEPS